MTNIKVYLRGHTEEHVFAMVDDEDAIRLSTFKWYLRRGYAVCKPRKVGDLNVTRLMHRIIFNINDPKIALDHINNNKLDNRKANLRICTQAQNRRNSIKRCDAKTSGYKGVSTYKPTNKWCAKIQIDYKSINVGYFATEIDAAIAYDVAAKYFFGEYANLNFSVIDAIKDKKIDTFRFTKRKGQSKYFGVRRSGKKSWITIIKINGKYCRFGPYDNERLAAEVYDDKAIKALGRLTRLNFPVPLTVDEFTDCLTKQLEKKSRKLGIVNGKNS